MIKEKTYYDIICDRCGKSLTQESGYYYPDANTAAFDASVSEWLIIDGQHYCPDCYDVDEETDEYVPKVMERQEGVTTDKQGCPILDACCGGKMFYFDKADPRVLFQDIRELETSLCDGRKFEVSPDVVADFTVMPHADCSFSMVVFDPPHLKYTGSKKELDGRQMIKYGHLGSDWKDVLRKGFSECFRVLRPGGFLIFKWNETDISISEILKLTDKKPVFGHRSGKTAKTHLVCFMKEQGVTINP